MSAKTAGTFVVALAVAALALPGCGEKKSERKYNTIEGTALSIDPATGQVSMRWYHAKKQMWREVAGEVTDETEVLINGRAAKLEEVRPGDPVKVVGYQEGEGLDRHFVATKVMVTREDLSSDSEEDQSPAAAKQPAD